MLRFSLITLMKAVTVIAILTFYGNQWRITRPGYLVEKYNRLRDDQQYDQAAETAELFCRLYPDDLVGRHLAIQAEYIQQYVRHEKMLSLAEPTDNPLYDGHPRCAKCDKYCLAPLERWIPPMY